MAGGPRAGAATLLVCSGDPRLGGSSLQATLQHYPLIEDNLEGTVGLPSGWPILAKLKDPSQRLTLLRLALNIDETIGGRLETLRRWRM